jgi:hypothetical protein
VRHARVPDATQKRRTRNAQRVAKHARAWRAQPSPRFAARSSWIT